jgi:hypothetical protein
MRSRICVMRKLLGVPIFAATSCAVLVSSSLAAQEENTVSLQEQLKAQYKVVKVSADATGLKIVDPGTVLDVKKGGLLGVPPMSMAFCPAKFQDNELKEPPAMCVAMVKQMSRYFQVGEKVYPLRIDVILDKDRVAFQLVECDSCNGVQQPSYYKSEVIFQFAKGSLRGMAVPQVEDTISQVLAISDNDSQANGQGQNQDSNAGKGGGGGAQQQQQQQQDPQQISVGQTPDQVKAALGNPDKMVNLGAKQIWVYKDLKVTFMNGKVSDVQ